MTSERWGDGRRDNTSDKVFGDDNMLLVVESLKHTLSCLAAMFNEEISAYNNDNKI